MNKSNSHSLNTSHRLRPQVFVLRVCRNEMKNNNYLVVDPATKQAVVIDPAWQAGKLDDALALTRSTLKGVLLTHSHSDHVDLAPHMSEKYSCPIWMSSIEIAYSGFEAPKLAAISEHSWSVGKMLIEPILTPGHTPGSVCYRIGHSVFSGDVLFPEGCGICFDIESAYMMYDSLEKLKSILKAEDRVYPGHTYLRQPGREFSRISKENMYLQFPNKEMFASYRLRPGQAKSSLLKFT